jgi:aspartate carbamoyltransferase catalytic subunit
MADLKGLSWDDFVALSPEEKAPLFASEGRPFHVLLAQQFDRSQLESLGRTATRIRRLAKRKEGVLFLRGLLAHKRAMLYFTQPSTRTFLSFLAAAEILGMSTGEVRDRSTSSELKGESPEDSVRTFSSYFDLIVMRSEIGGLAERMAWVLSNSDRPVPIVNAGSGKDQHPTQALLDIYTLQRSFEEQGGIDGKRVVFVGDLRRGRTVRSLALLLRNYRDVELCFVAPEALQVAPEIREQLQQDGVRFELSDDLTPLLPGADAVYMTRVQDEWDREEGESGKLDLERYVLGADALKLMKRSAIVMHPLPRRNEIPVEVDRDPRAMYWRQMRNGMWIRTALIATMFGCEREVDAYDESAPDA